MIVFSGRFDPVHPGHLAQVIRLTKKFEKVKVIILNYPERIFPVSYISDIFEEICGSYAVEVYVNTTHFAHLSKEEWKSFGCEYYAGGNLKVLRHLESLGARTVYVDRAYEYSARNYVLKE